MFSTNFDDHEDRRGYTVQALAQWWHPVALNEALDVLHQVMCPTLYCCIHTAIEVASSLPAFFVDVDFVVGHNRS